MKILGGVGNAMFLLADSFFIFHMSTSPAAAHIRFQAWSSFLPNGAVGEDGPFGLPLLKTGLSIDCGEPDKGHLFCINNTIILVELT